MYKTIKITENSYRKLKFLSALYKQSIVFIINISIEKFISIKEDVDLYDEIGISISLQSALMVVGKSQEKLDDYLYFMKKTRNEKE